MNRLAMFSQLFEIGKDILSTSIDKVTNTILAQLGDSTTSVSTGSDAEWWQHTGFWSRPAKPTSGASSCQQLSIKGGDRDIVFASRDIRAQGIYNNLGDGETCVGASTGQAKTIYRADGSASTATTDDNTSQGRTIFRRLSPTEDRFFSPWGSCLHDKTGWHLRTFTGAKIDVGGLGLPAPLSAFSSNVMISADMVNVDAALLSLGRDVGFTQAVVQALPLSVVLGSLKTAMAAISTALADINVALGTPGSLVAPNGPVVVSNAATINTDLGAAVTAIGTANTALLTVGNPAVSGGCATNTTVA